MYCIKISETTMYFFLISDHKSRQIERVQKTPAGSKTSPETIKAQRLLQNSRHRQECNR